MTNSTRPSFLDASSFGRSSTIPFVDFFSDRDPTANDVNFQIQKKWLNTDTDTLWMLKNFDTISGVIVANWIEISGTGPVSVREVGVDDHSLPGTNPVVPTAGGLISVTGSQIAAGSTANCIKTDSLQANQWTIEVQRSQAVASSTIGDNGVSHFDSDAFLVDANGFVQMNPDMPYYSLTPYIVGPDVHSQYSTIASAITQAVADGASTSNPKNIYIKPNGGGYIENLTISDGINLIGFGENTLIVGKTTMTTAGLASITDLKLQTNSDYFLEVTGSAASQINLIRCNLNCSDNTGINYTSSSASSAVQLLRCSGSIDIAGIALYSMSSVGAMQIQGLLFANVGNTTTPSDNSAGGVTFYFSAFNAPVSTSGTGAINFWWSSFDTATPAVTCITHDGTGSSFVKYSEITSGTASGISIGGAATLHLYNSSVSSSNANAITGTGNLSAAIIVFINSSSTINGTLTVTNFTVFGGTIV